MMHSRRTTILALSMMSVLVVGMASAGANAVGPATPAAVNETGAVPAPAGLQAASDLLGFGTNPAVSTCNTWAVHRNPVDAALDMVQEDFYLQGSNNQVIDIARHNGDVVSPDLLPFDVFTGQAPEKWEDAVHDVALTLQACTGGWCACIAFTYLPTAFVCFACCKAGADPFCTCSAARLYAECGCIPR